MFNENLLKIFFNSIIQGITEFLPISSSGHLFIINHFFSWDKMSLALIVSAHLGTLLAVIYYFWKDVKKIFFYGAMEIFKKKKIINNKLFVCLFYSSLPIIFLGFIFKFYNLNNLLHPISISFVAIIFSAILFISDKNKKVKKLNKITFNESIIIGLFQIFSLIPGASRAGVCISAARFLGFNKICATKYSMYLSIPTIFGASFLIILDILKENSLILWLEIFSIFILSFIFAFFTISYFFQLLKKFNFTIFVVYRIAFAILVLIFFI